jgi:hypothetical protein
LSIELKVVGGNYRIGQIVDVPIQVDKLATDPIVAGLQFILHYDPNNLEYVSFSTTGIYNDTNPGQISFANADLSGLTNPIGVATFVVHGPSDLTITDIVISDEVSNSLSFNVLNDSIEVINMLRTLAWSDPNTPPLGNYKLYHGTDGPDPAVNNFAVITTTSDTTAEFDFQENNGVQYFFVTGTFNHPIFGSGETAPSNVLTVDTAVPQAMQTLQIV